MPVHPPGWKAISRGRHYRFDSAGGKQRRKWRGSSGPARWETRSQGRKLNWRPWTPARTAPAAMATTTATWSTAGDATQAFLYQMILLFLWSIEAWRVGPPTAWGLNLLMATGGAQIWLIKTAAFTMSLKNRSSSSEEEQQMNYTSFWRAAVRRCIFRVT